MDQREVSKLLKKLGFFHIVVVDQDSKILFRAGHAIDALIDVVALDKDSGRLRGAYAGLIERVYPILIRYQEEADHAAFLSPELRKAWLDELASKAGLTPIELHSIASAKPQ